MRARRTDRNQRELVEILRKAGIRVHIWNDHADLICQFGGATMLCEVRPHKGGVQGAREGRQKRFQAEFMVKWLRTPEDALEAARTLKRWSAAQRAITEV